MPATVRAVLMLGGWLLWLIPFFMLRPKSRKAVKVDPRARWGILLAMAGFLLINTHNPQVWSSDIAPWRAAIAAVMILVSTAVAWSAVSHLGKQWRVEAGLNADHELIQTGVYRYIRHPIYTSMLGMATMCIALTGTWPNAVIGAVLCVLGTEIRVRVEDSLLRERFGGQFTEWQRRVPAYLPIHFQK